jgi:hypothetical protein
MNRGRSLDVVIACVVLLIVAVGVGFFGVMADSEKARRRWPSLK